VLNCLLAINNIENKIVKILLGKNFLKAFGKYPNLTDLLKLLTFFLLKVKNKKKFGMILGKGLLN
jgi:hypothetical protein